jgi:hypothetical protein
VAVLAELVMVRAAVVVLAVTGLAQEPQVEELLLNPQLAWQLRLITQ